MDPRYHDVFRHQIYRECRFALMAVEGINSALQVVREAEADKNENGPWNLPRREEGVWQLWYSIEAFLRATGNISKVFWPPRPREKELQAATEKRGVTLRRILQIGEDSPLKSRVLRDHFEHYDERIDEWYRDEKGRGDLIDSNLWGRKHLAKRKGYLRNFDPDEWTLFFVGDEVELKPLIAAVESLLPKVSSPLVDLGT